MGSGHRERSCQTRPVPVALHIRGCLLLRSGAWTTCGPVPGLTKDMALLTSSWHTCDAKQVRRPHIEWEKTFGNCISNKGLTSKIYRELIQLESQKANNLVFKMGKGHFGLQASAPSTSAGAYTSVSSPVFKPYKYLQNE